MKQLYFTSKASSKPLSIFYTLLMFISGYLMMCKLFRIELNYSTEGYKINVNCPARPWVLLLVVSCLQPFWSPFKPSSSTPSLSSYVQTSRFVGLQIHICRLLAVRICILFLEIARRLQGDLCLWLDNRRLLLFRIAVTLLPFCLSVLSREYQYLWALLYVPTLALLWEPILHFYLFFWQPAPFPFPSFLSLQSHFCLLWQ